jgi:O-antigen ligase
MLFAFIGVAVVAAALASRTARRISGAEVLIGLYTGVALLSTLWSAAPTLTLVRATQLAVVAGLAIFAVRILTPAVALWATARTLTWFVLVCALIATIAPWTTLPLFPEEGVFRFRWFAIHPLDAATLTGTAAIGVLGLLVCARTPGTPTSPRMVMAALFVVLVTLLILTSSRGPMLALAAAIGVLWLIRMRPVMRGAALLAAASIVLAVILGASELRAWFEGIVSHDTVLTRLVMRNQSVDDVIELNGRLALWQELQPMVAEHAVMGTGYQASRAALLDVAAWAAYAHNALIQTVLDLGMVGLLSMLGLLALGVCAGFRRSNAPWVRATVPALTIFLALNSMSNESFAAAPDIELLVIFVCALCGTAMQSGPLRPAGPRSVS